MKLFVTGLLLLSSSAFASKNVNLDMTLTLNGKIVNPRLIVPYGQAGTISQKDALGNGFEVAVTPTETSVPTNPRKSVQLDLVISEFKANQKKVLATSEVNTFLGQSAMISQSKPGERELKLEILPRGIE